MKVDVVMPQMGESITEGTVSKWLKAVGDRVEKDEALLEISTDKVDAEVPSPGAGVLLAINTPEGETVEVGSVLAMVGAKGSSTAAQPKAEASSSKPAVQPTATPPEPKAQAATATPQSALRTSHSNGGNGNASIDELRRRRSSPLVRN